MPEIYQIRYDVGNGWSEANELMQEVEYGDADYSVLDEKARFATPAKVRLALCVNLPGF